MLTLLHSSTTAHPVQTQLSIPGLQLQHAEISSFQAAKSVLCMLSLAPGVPVLLYCRSARLRHHLIPESPFTKALLPASTCLEV